MPPRADEYNIAVQNPISCFSDGDLKHGQVQTNNLGLPIPYSGGFTTTYRISSGNFYYAVRCFTREVGHLHLRYQAIDDFIDKNKSNYLVEARYLKLGIQISGKWYPIIKMKWIDGDLLNVYIGKIINHDKEELKRFLEKFEQFIENLEKDRVAHGDLQHGNIILKNDNIFLIDYDGFYLPEIEKVGTGEVGHPNYQHPKRTLAYFDEKNDRFAAITIYFSLKALLIKPELWKKYYNGENLLFKKDDFNNPENSELFFSLTQISEIEEDAYRFASICKGRYEEVPSLKDFIRGNLNYSRIDIQKPVVVKSSVGKDGADVFAKLYGGTMVITSNGGFKYNPTTTVSKIGNINSGTTQTHNFGSIATTTLKTKQVSSVERFYVGMLLAIGIIATIFFVGSNFSDDSSVGKSGGSMSNIVATSTSTDKNCALGMIKSETSGNCVTRDVYCQEKNGINGEWDGNFCDCKTGFKLDLAGKKCITQDQSCKEKNGQFGLYTNGSCGCVKGYVFSSESNKCVTNDQLCKESHGAQSMYDGANCTCPAGYVFNYNQTECVFVQKTNDQKCKEQYGSFSKSSGVRDGTNYCDCENGYEWNNNDLSKATKCVKSCGYGQCSQYGQCVTKPLNSQCAVDGWICNAGYKQAGNSCVSNDLDYNGCGDSICKIKHGSNSIYSFYNPANKTCTCGCQSGYEWNADHTACIAECDYLEYRLGNFCYSSSELTAACKKKNGSGSYFNGEISNGKYACDCMDGYYWSGSYCALDY